MPGRIAVGMVFLPRTDFNGKRCTIVDRGFGLRLAF
jgi:hypothetical protein